jgi:protein arginine N-methyltransferase 1
MYDVNDYGRMMADPVRMHAYSESLRRAVKPGSVVVDVGTGTGIFALLAARFGARKVYAIDVNPCIHLAREVAKANGFADKIEFIHKSVFDVELPEKADVLVGDCRGNFPVYDYNLEIMRHACERWLQADGVLIVEKDDLFVTLVHRPELQRDLHEPWHLFGFDWSACRREAFLSRTAPKESNGELQGSLTDPAIWATIDYRRLTSPNVKGHTKLAVRQSGNVHALASWFRATTAFGHQFGDHVGVYRPLILPIEPPLEVRSGESVDVELTALRSKDGYLMAWTVTTPSETRRYVNDGLADLVISARSRT